eukprot:SAG31_NODE_16192_length_716_cov_1.096774_2_plen_26_part_01
MILFTRDFVMLFQNRARAVRVACIAP